MTRGNQEPSGDASKVSFTHWLEQGLRWNEAMKREIADVKAKLVESRRMCREKDQQLEERNKSIAKFREAEAKFRMVAPALTKKLERYKETSRAQEREIARLRALLPEPKKQKEFAAYRKRSSLKAPPQAIATPKRRRPSTPTVHSSSGTASPPVSSESASPQATMAQRFGQPPKKRKKSPKKRNLMEAECKEEFEGPYPRGLHAVVPDNDQPELPGPSGAVSSSYEMVGAPNDFGTSSLSNDYIVRGVSTTEDAPTTPTTKSMSLATDDASFSSRRPTARSRRPAARTFGKRRRSSRLELKAQRNAVACSPARPADAVTPSSKRRRSSSPCPRRSGAKRARGSRRSPSKHRGRRRVGLPSRSVCTAETSGRSTPSEAKTNEDATQVQAPPTHLQASPPTPPLECSRLAFGMSPPMSTSYGNDDDSVEPPSTLGEEDDDEASEKLLEQQRLEEEMERRRAKVYSEIDEDIFAADISAES